MTATRHRVTVLEREVADLRRELARHTTIGHPRPATPPRPPLLATLARTVAAVLTLPIHLLGGGR